MNGKKNAALKAAEFVKDGMTVGLGTGSTAGYFIERLGQMVAEGLSIRGVATSKNTESLARGFGIPLADIDEVTAIDIDVDGVDEIDPAFNAIKGGGGALLREKIVATLARQVIWIAGGGKRVEALGAFPLAVEVIPFGHSHLLRRFEGAGLNPVLRLRDGEPWVTDSGNCIIDLHTGAPMDVAGVRAAVEGVPGVVETGLFLNTCHILIEGTETDARVIVNHRKD